MGGILLDFRPEQHEERGDGGPRGRNQEPLEESE
jgi:hypothetical protein